MTLSSETHSLFKATESRRSIYQLNDKTPISKDDIIKIVEHSIKYTPSSFNSQTTRAVVLFGDDHKALWELTAEEVKKVAPGDFAPTQAKIDGFAAGAGTVLFFEDQSIVKSLQERFSLYADNFPVWSEQTDGMVTYAVWTDLSVEGVGANLQHYNPLIDGRVAEKWNIPSDWLLRSQLIFGGIDAEAGEKDFMPVDERVLTFGA
ncbi:MAG TPA: nitroreductase family protein [Bavariicoccus seileri]|uniref:Nitroreductase family protein n=1 Tax=Bavariicoccus seileri TaxID=549685 RepID=A0A3D4S7Z4_9ENTE|nr:nitroreductase family protein [Bavariicoccus seileri]HCS94081.1 nitroreductase family protein [Bavariicoccus seileri]